MKSLTSGLHPVKTIPVSNVTVPTTPSDPSLGLVDAAEFRQLQQDVATILSRLNIVQMELRNVVSAVASLPDVASDVAQILTYVERRTMLTEYEERDNDDLLAQASENVAFDMVNNALIDHTDSDGDGNGTSDDESMF